MRTREDILEDIEHYAKWTEEYTKRGEKAKQELKEFDELKEQGSD